MGLEVWRKTRGNNAPLEEKRYFLQSKQTRGGRGSYDSANVLEGRSWNCLRCPEDAKQNLKNMIKAKLIAYARTHTQALTIPWAVWGVRPRQSNSAIVTSGCRCSMLFSPPRPPDVSNVAGKILQRVSEVGKISLCTLGTHTHTQTFSVLIRHVFRTHTRTAPNQNYSRPSAA